MDELPAQPRPAWSPVAAFAVAVGVFVAAFLASRALPESVATRAPWARQAVAQGIMLVFALGAMAASQRPWAEFGFRRPMTPPGFLQIGGVWGLVVSAVLLILRVVSARVQLAASLVPGLVRPAPALGWYKLWGFLLGIAGTLLILTPGLKGMQGRMAAYGFPGIVFWIWVVSSTVEEVYCRGWFQTVITGGDSEPEGPNPQAAVVPQLEALRGVARTDGPRARAAVIWSAALFGSMHLTLLFGDMEVAAALIIIASVTVLGYVCAQARARTGSLRPAILAHVLFNVGGLVGGLIYTAVYRVATGHLPAL